MSGDFRLPPEDDPALVTAAQAAAAEADSASEFEALLRSRGWPVEVAEHDELTVVGEPVLLVRRRGRSVAARAQSRVGRASETFDPAPVLRHPGGGHRASVHGHPLEPARRRHLSRHRPLALVAVLPVWALATAALEYFLTLPRLQPWLIMQTPFWIAGLVHLASASAYPVVYVVRRRLAEPALPYGRAGRPVPPVCHSKEYPVRIARVILLASALLVLTACGGGGDRDNRAA